MQPKFLEFLVCPISKTPLQYDEAAQELVSLSAGVAYPIRDGIPILIPEEARTFDAPILNSSSASSQRALSH